MNIRALEEVAKSIRSLSIDAIEKANSGHPGLPLGCAELGAVLYGEILNHYPAEPKWINRDRFVLSAGHGSMLLYSLLYLSGYGLKKEDLMNFRQLGSPTPGHPEYWCTPGVETTTGPLGQGFANGVGMAIAERMLAGRFNTDKHRIIDHYIYVLASDGCIMEGISAEAASIAGHLGIGNLIVFYDYNKITIEGSTDLAFSEDVLARFSAYGWHTLSGDAYDMKFISELVGEAKAERNKPSIILLKSVIGKGAPGKAGSHSVHGAPLGAEEAQAAKKSLGIPEDIPFWVSPEAEEYFHEKQKIWKDRYDRWQEVYDKWSRENPELKREFETWIGDNSPNIESIGVPAFSIGEKVATRKASGKVLNFLAKEIPNLVGGSADLAPSNVTEMEGCGDFSANNPLGRNFHFGIREHAMGSITNGISLHGGFKPFCATFLVFSDYMRPAIRLAALMKLPVIYVFTHDSIFVGEDGPTHQPVEHLQALRVIPGLIVLRPGDAQETAVAWQMALERRDGPTALALTRQDLEVYRKDDLDWKKNMRRGAYIVKDTQGVPDVIIVATGSEVGLALKAVPSISGKKVRIVSMISRELFLSQENSFREEILPSGCSIFVVEAGLSTGWEAIASSPRNILSINRFGESAPGAKLAEHLGFTAEKLVEMIID